MDDKKLRQEIASSILGSEVGAFSLEKQGRAWTKNNDLLGIPLPSSNDARNWSVHDVASYVDIIVSSNNSNHIIQEQINIPQHFIDQEVDGESFLMLTQEDLMKVLKIPLGKSIKIINAIIMLRQQAAELEFNENICSKK